VAGVKEVVGLVVVLKHILKNKLVFEKDINAVKQPMAAPIIRDSRKMEKKSLNERRKAVVSNSPVLE